MTAAAGSTALALPRLALLDLDGTLVDTVPDIAWCADRMLESIGREPCGAARVRDWVGNGIERLVERTLAGTLDGAPDPALLARALPIFAGLYAAHGCELSHVYPGVEAGLDWLATQGVRLACVTNKPARFTGPLLERLGLRARFELVVSGDTVATKKPDPAPLVHAAATLGVPTGRCLVIGDSVNDLRAARAAGMRVVCVSYGYNHGADVHAAGADAVVDSLAELRRILARPAGHG